MKLPRLVSNGSCRQWARRPFSTSCISRRQQLQSTVIAKCPDPTCACAPTPELPSDSDPVDHTSQLLGTVAIHNRLIVIGTGERYSGHAWPSRIESDGRGIGADVIRSVKEATGIRGQQHNAYWNSMVVASSFGSDSDQGSSAEKTTDSNSTATALVFPQGIQVEGLHISKTRQFVASYILPTEAELETSLGRRQLDKDQLSALPLNAGSDTNSLEYAQLVDPVVLICGHGQRDGRCGVLGPVLRDEFRRQLARAGIDITAQPQTGSIQPKQSATSASVGLVSHIGGHKFAGNVLIFVPTTLQDNPLAGTTVWYGRVEPRHVQGIVHETLKKGNIIKELLRGGMDANGAMLDLRNLSSVTEPNV